MVHAYGAIAFDGNEIILKLDAVRLSKLLPKVVVANGVIVGVGGMVIYGGDALTTPHSAHKDDNIVRIYFLNPNIIIKYYNFFSHKYFSTYHPASVS